MKLSGLSQQESDAIVLPGTILLAYRGSIAHGMYVPNYEPNSIDDKDLLGVCVPGERFYLGLSHFEQKEMMYKEWDSVTYEIRKFFRLLIQSNPNVLSLLFTDPKYFLIQTQESEELLANRELFVSRKAFHSFTGYAHAQFQKMTHAACNGYMGEKRKRLVEKFGYDTKNAAHLIRLLHMGIEYLNEGVLYVDRGAKGDAPYLLSVKRGEWKLEQVKEEAMRLFKRAEDAYDRSKLKDKPDEEAIGELCIRLVKSVLSKEDK